MTNDEKVNIYGVEPVFYQKMAKYVSEIKHRYKKWKLFQKTNNGVYISNWPGWWQVWLEKVKVWGGTGDLLDTCFDTESD